MSVLYPTKITGLTLGLLAFSTPLTTFAFEPTDEVIVTATKQNKTIKELGLSLSVVGGEELSQFDGAEDLATRVAGLQAAAAPDDP